MSKKIKPTPPWREFEIAVASFIQAVDPNATVKNNLKTADADTGSPRQRDVWIEGRICKLFPIKVIVSCKKYDRVLNEMDIDHFIGELLSSEADKGVIYSYQGFNDLAIEKCKSNHICCMKLYQNQPPDIPEILILPHSYCCYPRFHLAVIWKKDPDNSLNTWNDIFNRPSGESKPEESVLDFILDILSQNQKKVIEKMASNGYLPMDWSFEFTFVDSINENMQVRIQLAQIWDIYEARLEAYNVNGTYSFTEKEFFGSIGTPAIDTWASEPGPGWTKCTKRPGSKTSHMSFTRLFGDIRPAIREIIGPKELG